MVDNPRIFTQIRAGVQQFHPIYLLLRPPVQPARVALSLAEPPAQELRVRLFVQCMPDGQRAHAREDLPRVRLGARDAPEPAVEVAAAVGVVR